MEYERVHHFSTYPKKNEIKQYSDFIVYSKSDDYYLSESWNEMENDLIKEANTKTWKDFFLIEKKKNWEPYFRKINLQYKKATYLHFHEVILYGLVFSL